MRKTLKKYFIPHEGNDHRPHILRDEAALVLIGALLFLELCFLVGSYALTGSSFLASILPAVLTDETNVSRATEGLAALTYNPLLEKAATLKAHDMAEKGYFAHTSPAGVTPWYWLSEAGYEFKAAGENLAVNYFDSKDVAEAWMKSPTHRANVMNPQFSEIGVGFAEGTYEGKNTVFVAEFFGTPAPAPQSEVPVSVDPAPASVVEVASTPTTAAVQPAASPAPEPVPVTDVVVQSVDVSVPVITAVKGVSIYRVAASPRRTMAWILFILMTVIAAAIAIKVFVTAYAGRPQQHGLVVNGMLLIVIMVSVLALNQFIGLLPSVV